MGLPLHMGNLRFQIVAFICKYKKYINYYEHIIRNEEELNNVRQYIADNSLNWRTDEENPDVTAKP